MEVIKQKAMQQLDITNQRHAAEAKTIFYRVYPNEIEEARVKTGYKNV